MEPNDGGGLIVYSGSLRNKVQLKLELKKDCFFGDELKSSFTSVCL